MSAGGMMTIAFDGSLDLFIGCIKVSAGCANCPVCASLARKGYPKGIVYSSTVREWEKIHNRCQIRPNGIYLLCSTSDFFIEDGESRWDEIVAKLRSRPDVVFVALTKRPEQANKFVARYGVLPNLWLGVSAEDQRSLDERVPLLYTIPAAGYVISLQPLLGPIDLMPYPINRRLSYVITGCEHGDHARPCEKDWIDHIKRQCRRCHVECFVTRWRDDQGHVHTASKRNGTGSNRRDRPGYNPRHRHMPTVLNMMRKRWAA